MELTFREEYGPVGTPTYQVHPCGWRMEGPLLLVCWGRGAPKGAVDHGEACTNALRKRFHGAR